MSPQAGSILVNDIAPRLRCAVPKSVKPTGAEDQEELVQDAIAMAAQMLHSIEQAGKSIRPGEVIYYTVLHMKFGRRSNGRARTDAMATAVGAHQRERVLSLDEPLAFDPELEEQITWSDLLASETADPSAEAARRLDGEYLTDEQDGQQENNQWRIPVITLLALQGR